MARAHVPGHVTTQHQPMEAMIALGTPMKPNRATILSVRVKKKCNVSTFLPFSCVPNKYFTKPAAF
jgi:hypothetical protein